MKGMFLPVLEPHQKLAVVNELQAMNGSPVWDEAPQFSPLVPPDVVPHGEPADSVAVEVFWRSNDPTLKAGGQLGRLGIFQARFRFEADGRVVLTDI